jgi:hypothetical protein
MSTLRAPEFWLPLAFGFIWGVWLYWVSLAHPPVNVQLLYYLSQGAR